MLWWRQVANASRLYACSCSARMWIPTVEYVPSHVPSYHKGKPPLSQAVEIGEVEVLQPLLQREDLGPNILNSNVQDSDQVTALHNAVSHCEMPRVDALLADSRVDPNASDFQGDPHSPWRPNLERWRLSQGFSDGPTCGRMIWTCTSDLLSHAPRRRDVCGWLSCYSSGPTSMSLW
ncbi:hypothetical protein BP00DRAFT_167185 [Aspergillus indologenus CBS 114.80]|uniref:Uncharacterized protein n=1 Tax=Aspergillus indologenus CBS 114.80 TaxID=1450541 RepID=A0A2V5I4X2_9EURO|nr:hypothetical protein BP00DRAFT_167185 [Aspergillus indologenus CBS 114.80]